MSRLLFDLCAADPALRFSPYCWRVKLALKHKGLDFNTVPWRFQEKERLAFAYPDGAVPRTVPVLQEPDGTVVTDSLAIFAHLDRVYPEQPLLGDAMASARLTFIRYWSEALVAPAIMRIILMDLFAILGPEDQEYFRKSREARLGKTLEDFCDPEVGQTQLAKALAPLRLSLGEQPYLDGAQPAAADYLAFATFMWPYVATGNALLPKEGPLNAWFSRMLEQFDGFAAAAPRVI